MPWKTFMYKALNAFVDDLFAFIIKMPTMHRLACLRDDLIFFCYLYQRWQYGIDAKRPNEYGQVATDEDTPAQLTTVEGAESAEGAEGAEGAKGSAAAAAAAAATTPASAASAASAAAAAASAALGAPPLPPVAARAEAMNAKQ